jgi:hypothetical protein
MASHLGFFGAPCGFNPFDVRSYLWRQWIEAATPIGHVKDKLDADIRMHALLAYASALAFP